jgi:hypothetical protein
MIEIFEGFSSPGRNFGNKLFAYSLGIILSEIQNLNLYIPKDSYIQRNGNVMLFPFNNIENKRDITNPTVHVTDDTLVVMGLEMFIKNYKDNHIFLDGYFSKYEYVKHHKEIIKKTYSSLISKKKYNNNILIMLRDSNIDPTFALPNTFYLEILERENFDAVFVSYDHYEKHINLIKTLQQKYVVVLLDLNILELFKEITSFNKIIAAQGTFSFWAAFLSNAEKIYWPITKIGPNIVGYRDVNLIVDDEPRYEFIML